ncbi:hypothetical protein DPMN_069076 [Dreissena polymorpha]|uniref:Uncharacterized protein n=1 Tax=Dreissena polymorpha TaxID=45954 RepID=A0A9D3Z0E8_DREPO|nr:hypothetical protein DPMN_069076 [Dreissena polymorpha]
MMNRVQHENDEAFTSGYEHTGLVDDEADHNRLVDDEAFPTDDDAFTADDEAFTTDDDAFTTDDEAFTTDDDAFPTDDGAFTTSQRLEDNEARTTAFTTDYYALTKDYREHHIR